MFPNWRTLKALSNSPLAKLTIIVPVVGWLLLYNNMLVSIIENITGVEADPDDLWKLYVFYVGLTLISFSAILFVVFCPRIISHFPDFNEYIEVERKTFTPNLETQLSSERGFEPLNWEAPPEAYKQMGGGFPLSRMYEANERIILDRMREIYDHDNSSNFIVRVLSAIFFVIGALLAFIPALSTLCWCLYSLYTLVVGDGS